MPIHFLGQNVLRTFVVPAYFEKNWANTLHRNGVLATKISDAVITPFLYLSITSSLVFESVRQCLESIAHIPLIPFPILKSVFRFPLSAFLFPLNTYPRTYECFHMQCSWRIRYIFGLHRLARRGFCLFDQ
jgi:hypothetical protein